jgi:hypothetical protein
MAGEAGRPVPGDEELLATRVRRRPAGDEMTQEIPILPLLH